MHQIKKKSEKHLLYTCLYDTINRLMQSNALFLRRKILIYYHLVKNILYHLSLILLEMSQDIFCHKMCHQVAKKTILLIAIAGLIILYCYICFVLVWNLNPCRDLLDFGQYNKSMWTTNGCKIHSYTQK